jgi:RNA polymerase sigma factor (sigma-70 family)
VPDFPPEVTSLLEAPDDATRELAWAQFVSEHTNLLMGACRLLGGDHDAVMDRYAYVLDYLRRDDFRRLRQFVGDGRCKFTTWLVVIARRLSLDHHRGLFGRVRADELEADKQERRRTRHDLAMLVSSHNELDGLADPTGMDPEAKLVAEEQTAGLEAALEELETRDRLLLRLRFSDALAAQEIARVMGFQSPFHVYRRLNQLFDLLRRALRQRGIRGSVP